MKDRLNNIPPQKISKYLEDLIKSHGDSIGLQFHISKDEIRKNCGYVEDIQNDREYEVVKGVIHRYPHKVLLCPSWGCFSQCRFCFRRNFIGEHRMDEQELDNAISYIKHKDEVNEVILSGGDPFTISDAMFSLIIKKLSRLRNVRFIRIHTRVFTHYPKRITDNLIKILKKSSGIAIVMHINHPDEISKEFKSVIRKLKKNGINNLFAQTVLLKKINDNSDILKQLFEELFFLGIKPHYLYHCDPVEGIKHFRISLKKGINIFKKLQNRVSGLALPKYVLELPNGNGKIPVDLGFYKRKEGNYHTFENFEGKKVKYLDEF